MYLSSRCGKVDSPASTHGSRRTHGETGGGWAATKLPPMLPINQAKPSSLTSASPYAKLAAVVVLPTPPFPEVTTTTQPPPPPLSLPPPAPDAAVDNRRLLLLLIGRQGRGCGLYPSLQQDGNGRAGRAGGEEGYSRQFLV